jgi:hypothetical protein
MLEINNICINFREKKNLIFSSFFVTFFVFPIIYFGIKDLEEYTLGYFTLKTYIKYPESFWNGYIDFYGPGAKLPIGHFPILHPANFFIANTQLHYFFFVTINLVIQILFLRKIFKFFFGCSHFIILLIIFSIFNFNYVYSDDWPTAFFCISIFFPSFFYLIKFLKKKSWVSYLKFIFWISFGFFNGHLGSLVPQYIFFVLFILINKKFFFFKDIKFYLGIIIFIMISSNVIFHLLSEFFLFEKNIPSGINTQNSYSIKGFITSLINPFYNTEFQQNRAPYFGIFVPIALIISIKNLLNLKLSKEIFFLDKIFLIFIFFSLNDYTKFLYIASAVWQFRDYYNILSIILIFFFFNKNKFLLKIFITVQLIFVLLFYITNFRYIDLSKSNFIVKKNINNETLFYENINSKIKKTYLSPKVFDKIRNKFKNYGIYSVTDLQSYNIYTFNGWFKNYSVDDFQKPETKIHGKISSSYDDLNNVFFLKNFLVNKIIFFKSEIENFNIKNYKITKIIKFENDDLIYAEMVNDGFPTFETVNGTNFNCGQEEKFLKCLLKKNFILKPIEINRLKLNQYEIFNKNNQDVNIIFPLAEYKNWFNKKKEIKSYDKFQKIGILNLAANERVVFTYKDNLRFTLNLISLLSLTFLFIIIIFKKNNIN